MSPQRRASESNLCGLPVILAALIPGGIAAMPGTELHGANTVVPVMNMVLMARELLLGHYEWDHRPGFAKHQLLCHGSYHHRIESV